MKNTIILSLTLGLVFVVGCAPASFVRQPAGWKTIELRKDIQESYPKAWQVAVDTVAREWDIEILDKESGYLRTAWKYGIAGTTGAASARYRGRMSLKFATVELGSPKKVEVKTDASWLDNYNYLWIEGYDTALQRDVYDVLSARLGRTVPE